MVVDRLSNEAAADTVVAQKLGNQSELRLLKNEVLLAGVTNRLERAGRTEPLLSIILSILSSKNLQ